MHLPRAISPWKGQEITDGNINPRTNCAIILSPERATHRISLLFCRPFGILVFLIP